MRRHNPPVIWGDCYIFPVVFQPFSRFLIYISLDQLGYSSLCYISLVGVFVSLLNIKPATAKTELRPYSYRL